MDSAPSLTVPNTAAFTECMRLPRPDEIHGSAQMPSWIQDIYSKIAEHNKLIEIQKTQLQQMHALAKKNQELQLALEEAHLKIAQLESATNHSLPPSPSTPPTPEQQPGGTSASQWAAMAAKPPLDESSPEIYKPQPTNPHTPPKTTPAPETTPAPKTKPKRTITLAQVSRFYSPPSKNQGYQFLHFTARGRERISEIRAGLPILGISKSRILDIHFPTNTTISFLVHNDYASTVIDAMSKLPASKLITDFDPCAPSLLRDSKYTNIADPLVLQSEAIRIYQERLIRLVQRLPTQHLQLAVARDFFFHHKWIPEATYQTIYRSIYPAKTPKDTSSSVPDDVTMDSVPDS